jgi:N-acetylglutamate synthase-like GNAT family acetyltransferase
MSHVGGFGIAIKQGYGGIGIGTRIMQTLVEESKKAGLRVWFLRSSTLTTWSNACIKKWGSKKLAEFQKEFTRMVSTSTQSA